MFVLLRLKLQSVSQATDLQTTNRYLPYIGHPLNVLLFLVMSRHSNILYDSSYDQEDFFFGSLFYSTYITLVSLLVPIHTCLCLLSNRCWIQKPWLFCSSCYRRIGVCAAIIRYGSMP